MSVGASSQGQIVSREAAKIIFFRMKCGLF